MAEPMKKTSCQIASWAMGAGAGFLAFLVLLFLRDWSFLQAVFGAGVIFLVVGGFLAFVMCRPLPSLGEIQAGMGEMADPVTPAQRSAASDVTTPAPEAAPAPAPSAQAAAAAAPAAITPAAEAEAKAETAAQAAPAPTPTPTPTPAAPASAATPAAAPEAAPASGAETETPVGTKPATLQAARGGQPDDLKQIKGVGPKMESMLHGMGFFHFDQVAAWTPSELAWVDENLTGFKGRASRDNWVAQAKALARGEQPDV
ncbi:MAG: hypothetical protein ACNA7O_13210 [Rhodobacterales bacterium]